jgi:CTP synthase (UTP-ammonia lyase)
MAKLSLFCNVPEENVLSIFDVPDIYHVPLLMIQQNLPSLLLSRLNLVSTYKLPPSLMPEKSPERTLNRSIDQDLSELSDCVSANEVFISQWCSMVKQGDQLRTFVTCSNKGNQSARNDMNSTYLDKSKSEDSEPIRRNMVARVALVGKYISQRDAYLSVKSALEHRLDSHHQSPS